MESEETKKNEHTLILLLSSAQSGRRRSASSILGTYVPFEVGTPTPLVRHCVRNYQGLMPPPLGVASLSTLIGGDVVLMRFDRGTKPTDLIARIDVHGPVHGRSMVRW